MALVLKMVFLTIILLVLSGELVANCSEVNTTWITDRLARMEELLARYIDGPAPPPPSGGWFSWYADAPPVEVTGFTRAAIQQLTDMMPENNFMLLYHVLAIIMLIYFTFGIFYRVGRMGVKLWRLVKAGMRAKRQALIETISSASSAQELSCPTVFIQERARPESPLVNVTALPTHQVMIEVSYGAEFYYVGMGFRVDDYLVTVYHNVDGASAIRVSNARGVEEIKGGLGAFKQYETDIAVALVDGSVFSKLGVTTAKLSSAMALKSSGCYGQIVGGKIHQQSAGMIMPCDAFGYVRYSGSTLSGFSGAPYGMGKRVLGMHVGAHTDNIGYDAAFLELLLRSRKESSEEWLEDEIEKMEMMGRKVQARRSPMDPSEAYIKLHGRFHVWDVSDMGDLARFHWVEAFEDKYDYESYKDQGNSNGALRGPVSALAAQRTDNALKHSSQKCAETLFKRQTGQMNQLLDPQESTPAPQDEVSPSIDDTIKKLEKELNLLRKKRKSTFSKGRNTSSGAGTSQSNRSKRDSSGE